MPHPIFLFDPAIQLQMKLKDSLTGWGRKSETEPGGGEKSKATLLNTPSRLVLDVPKTSYTPYIDE